LSTLDLYKELFKYLKPYRRRFIVALLAMILYGATDGAVPFLIREVLDGVFGDRRTDLLYLIPPVLVVFAIFRGAFGFLEKYLAATVGHRIIRDLRNDISAHLLSLSSNFYGRHTTGSLISRMTNDTLLVRSALTDAAASVLRDSVRVIALLSAAIYLDPALALIACVGLPIAILPVIRFGKRVRKLSKVGQDQFGGLTGVLQETIVGHRVVQAFAMEDYELNKFKKENDNLTGTFEKAERYGAMSAPINEIVASVAIAGVILYGGLSVISGVRSQGDFIAFITTLFLLYEPIKKLGRVNGIVQLGMAAAERIFEILNVKPEIADRTGAIDLNIENAAIEYKNIAFSYTDLSVNEGENSAEPTAEQRWVLTDINLKVETGQTVALVGMSGSGKSTLVNLLPRFYEPQQGAVLVNGHDVRDIKLKSLRSSIAVVSQHTFLFNDTIFNNIAYGRLGASEADVIAAAQASNAEDFILKLPQGYQTVIGEQGFSLSGGERSRLAIARALLRDAPILILDEATAALDSRSEKLVQQAIDRLKEGRTVLVIAHRLATVRNASKIVVMQAGVISEIGTHDELLRKGGEYSKLYRIQFQGQQEAVPKQASIGGN